MQARETRLTEFFEGPVKYVSPSFQRGYAWKRSRCDRYLRMLHPEGDGEMFLGAVVVMVTFGLVQTYQATVGRI